ncbi:Conserved hypothetical, protein [Geosmithia morbida]|uniref:Conserved hypothetical, protein n=1 Tax=Geosmithia morbida TaxID=1094350 RepID=A0A9P4YVL5_9HYPO|nr:Conserved hypothetical, protein [Geosmithia morbida]KAF4122503.1 Conserved hypothetical, protein [Geosmithia morbida]
MPSRFSAAFRRKSSANPDEFQSHQTIPSESSTSSFRVLERNPGPPGGPSFDGGARMAHSSPSFHKPTNSDSQIQDNIFSGLNTYRRRLTGIRGSGGSNTTKGTSTDTSSRHSNVSTAPSSADMAAHNHEDGRGAPRNTSRTQDPPARQAQKGGASGFFDRAGRSLSFGIQKKSHASQTPSSDHIPDMPPLPTLQREDENGRTRAMTASTTSTATPPKIEEQHKSDLDLGGDFSTMFNRFGKRASGVTIGSDKKAPSPELAANSWEGRFSTSANRASSDALSPQDSSSTPRHQPSFEYGSASPEGGAMEDEDAKFLADSVAATRFLSDDGNRRKSRSSMALLNNDISFMKKPEPVYSPVENDENMFAGTSAGFSRPTALHPTAADRPAQRSSSPPRNSKVMTTAEFEKFQKDKERKHLEKAVYGGSASDDEDEDEDEINYDDEEDEEEKAKEQVRVKRSKQAQMLAYRQKNMKTTGNLNALSGPESPALSGRPSFPQSLSAPHLGGLAKTPSPELGPMEENDEDEEVPLAILQAHGFPSKNRSASRLSHFGSATNLNAAAHHQAQLQAQMGRPASAAGERASANMRRASALPAFARNLPTDPFVGAGVSRPAMRESLSFGSGIGTPQPQQSMHPGGLVGVIVSEERSKAMRRGSPNIDAQRFGASSMDPMATINPGSMYPGGVPRMPQAPAMGPAEQAQMQMNQQMTQFMQMQMQFMQMMAEGTRGGQMPQMPMGMQMPMGVNGMNMQQQQQGGNLPMNQSYADLGATQQMGTPLMQPRRMDAGNRTMSMVQPQTSSFLPHFNSPGPLGGPAVGYTPSIAPSERSNVGLPGRYRPVSQAGGAPNGRANTPNGLGGAHNVSFSGGLGAPPTSSHMRGPSLPTLSLSSYDDTNSKSTIRVTSQLATKTSSDEDDDEGWEAMQAKKEARKSRWRMKKVGEII